MVAAMRARLHEHATLEAEKRVQGEQVFLRGILWREGTVRREGEYMPRPDHVKMRVAAQGRQDQAGCLPSPYDSIRICRREDGTAVDITATI